MHKFAKQIQIGVHSKRIERFEEMKKGKLKGDCCSPCLSHKRNKYSILMESQRPNSQNAQSVDFHYRGNRQKECVKRRVRIPSSTHNNDNEKKIIIIIFDTNTSYISRFSLFVLLCFHSLDSFCFDCILLWYFVFVAAHCSIVANCLPRITNKKPEKKLSKMTNGTAMEIVGLWAVW